MTAKERLQNAIFLIFQRIEQECDHNGRFKKKTNLRMEKEEKRQKEKTRQTLGKTSRRWKENGTRKHVFENFFKKKKKQEKREKNTKRTK